jgi:uncharacterized protein
METQRTANGPRGNLDSMKQTLSFKAVGLKAEGDSGVVTGRASVYGVIDSYSDIVMPGAFTKTLQEHGGRIVVLSQHAPDVSIGMADLEDRRDGLHCRVQLLLDIQAAREDFVRAKAGAVTGISIGYETIRDDIDRKTGVRRLLEVRLWEISLVTFPANQSARVTGVKDRAAVDDPFGSKALLREMRATRDTIVLNDTKATTATINAATRDIKRILGRR